MHDLTPRTRLRATLGATVLAVSALLGGAAYAGGAPAAGPPSADVVRHGPVVRDDLQDVFRKAGVRGTFALLDVRAGRTTVVDRARAEQRLIPASTFKIPHSLIALETGVIADEYEVIPYGGQPQPFPEWEHDMNLRDAVRASNVPVFQTLARRIGLARERQWVNRLHYGDREIGGVVDRFWLDGPLEISAVEQTRFLSRLARRELPVAKAHQLTVRDILKIEEKDGYALFAKTGWGMSTEPGIGWWVGWVERGADLYTFALNIDVEQDADTAQRVPVARELLRSLGVLPAA
ncbi:beta-lactamase class D [Actinocorallia herbida]|uniref:Beta-lactamase n=1 Tax=Actinocorallia herbida TaxID=58109 RepID=A0A3N1CV12_9ACTN|nr:class D beta-lactamase [Actinocorallia herbida]ROO85064.1 beta-lactamase class D [Actinocorallia herbida]